MDILSLTNAARGNDLKKLEEILNKDNINQVYESEFWHTPIMLIAYVSNLKVLQFAHKLNANFSVKHRSGQNVLQWAAVSMTPDALDKCKYIIEQTKAVELNWDSVSKEIRDDLRAFVEMMLLKDKLDANLITPSFKRTQKL